MTGKTRKTGVITAMAGILGLVLLMWTPKTGKGILAYVVLFAVLAVIAIVFFPGKRAGYWPEKPDDH